MLPTHYPVLAICLSVAAAGAPEDPTKLLQKGELPGFKYHVELKKPGTATTPDGKMTLRHDGMTAWIIDAATNRAVRLPLEHTTNSRRKLQIKAFAFSPDGRYVVTGTGDVECDHRDTCGEVYLWEVATGKLLRKSTTDLGEVRRLTFSDDGKTILVDCLEISGK
jgi:WD40 repeat protein